MLGSTKLTFVDPFPDNVSCAANWTYVNIFQHPYPYLTPWLDQTVPPIAGMCPKQLVKFETELDCGKGNKVFRPNHGMIHSIRVAFYMALLCDLFKKHCNNQFFLDIVQNQNEVELLQIMMIFSVSGRVNEAGRARTNVMNPAELGLNQSNYMDSRIRSAEYFKRYCEETGYLDVFSEKFRLCFEAILHMEQRGDNSFTSKYYIHLMSLAHSMDLMRCFPPRLMNTIHQAIEEYFVDNPIYEANSINVRADIFSVLKKVELALRATGNRVTTGINVEEQSYFAANVPYNLDLFFYCTQDIVYTMNTLSQLNMDSELLRTDPARTLMFKYGIIKETDSTSEEIQQTTLANKTKPNNLGL